MPDETEMQAYIGTKIVRAGTMTERDWQNRKSLPLKGPPFRQGYMVVYADGYESWSPENVFEAAYRLISDDERKMV